MSRIAVPGAPLFRRVLSLAQIDKAVFYGLTARLWLAAAGPVSALLVAAFFSPELQGFYYTFSSLIALQVFAELGLGVVILHFASHEWTGLSISDGGQIKGDPAALSRLQSIARISVSWYLIAAALLTLTLVYAGEYFFLGADNYLIDWYTPWKVLCVLTGLNLALTPAWSILEGCNQVASVYGYRFWQAVISSIAAWMAIALGAELWTGVITSAITAGVAVYFVTSKYRVFFRTLLQKPKVHHRISWHKEMLPMQWRIAISWISGYFAFSLFVPVLFKYQGSVTAGQMGMTWSLVNVVGLAGAWLSPQIPKYGMLISKGKFMELDSLLWVTVRNVGFAACFIAVTLIAMVYLFELTGFFLAKRLLPIMPITIFLIAQVFVVSSLPFSAYLRAHKQEPLMILSVSAAICVAITTVVAARYSGPTEVAIGYLVVNLVAIPLVIWIWHQKRKAWRTAQIE
ncbi:MAG: hypothetical protein AB1560_00070 [Pseudomonadota bacterium]